MPTRPIPRPLFPTLILGAPARVRPRRGARENRGGRLPSPRRRRVAFPSRKAVRGGPTPPSPVAQKRQET